MVFQPRLPQFLLLPSAETSVNISRTPLRHTALPGSHFRSEGSRLDSVPGNGYCRGAQQYKATVREFILKRLLTFSPLG
jgi:hypothetical protein